MPRSAAQRWRHIKSSTTSWSRRLENASNGIKTISLLRETRHDPIGFADLAMTALQRPFDLVALADDKAAITYPGFACAAATSSEPSGIFLLAVHVVDQDAGTGRRHDHPLLPLQRPARVFVAALPVLAHRGAGELVVLGMTFVGFLLINNVQNGDLRQIGKLIEPAPVLLAQLILRHLLQRLGQQPFQIKDASVDVGGVA